MTLRDTNGLPVRFDCDCPECVPRPVTGCPCDRCRSTPPRMDEAMDYLARGFGMRYVQFTVSNEALQTAPSITEFVRQHITEANTDGLAVADADIQTHPNIETGSVTIVLTWPDDSYPSVTDEP